MTKTYEAAIAAHNTAQAAYAEAVAIYRAHPTRISAAERAAIDARFLAARAAKQDADAIFDTAFAAEAALSFTE